MLPWPKHWEKDLINNARIQLLANLLSEELLHDTRDHWFPFILCLKKNTNKIIKFYEDMNSLNYHRETTMKRPSQMLFFFPCDQKFDLIVEIESSVHNQTQPNTPEHLQLFSSSQSSLALKVL